MKHNIKGYSTSGINMEYILQDRQMSGTGYRQKFCQTLNDSEKNCL